MAVNVEVRATYAALETGFQKSKNIVKDGVSDMLKELSKLGPGSQKSVGVANTELSKFNGSAKETQGATAGIASGFKGMLGPMAAVAAATAVVMAGLAGLRELVDVQRTFDQISAGLITATGSAENADRAFQAIQDFATETPYSLEQVSQSFVKLVNMGLTPSERALTSYGNTAAAMGKGLDQMIEAVADAATGEFERLKEFGIKASTEGDKITFRFRGVSETVRNEAGAIEGYLMRLGETNFADSMSNRMDTLDGAISNLGDEWSKLFLNLSQSGLGDAIEDGVRLAIDVLGELNDFISSGQFEGYLEAMGAAFGPWAEDSVEAVDIAQDAFAGFADWLDSVAPGLVENYLSYWRDFPPNFRAIVQLATVYFANQMERMLTIARGFVDEVKAIFSDDTIFDADKRMLQRLAANETALRQSVAAIAEERDATIESTKAAIDGANARRVAYEQDKAARAAANAGKDRLAGFGVTPEGGDSGKGDKGKDAAAKAALREIERARKEAFQVEMETLRIELGEWENNYAERIRIAQEMAEAVKRQYGENSAEYKKAQRTIVEIEREKAEQIRQIGEVEKQTRITAAFASIDAAEQAADLELQLGNISMQQRLAIAAQFEAERFAIQRQALEERLAMMALDPDMNPVEYAKIKGELQQIEQGHQARLRELRNRSAVESSSGATNFFGAIETQFGAALNGMITRQQSASQVLRSAWQSLYASYVQEMVVKPLTQYAMRVLRESVLGKMLFGQQVATQAAASMATIGAKSAETTAVVGMNAAQAGAGAAASQASIPFIGPVLALAAMAAVFAAVSALGGGGGSKTTTSSTTLPSAANGFDIPAGVNPITQLHEQEMVLPAEQADVIRNMAGGGGAPPTIIVQAMDSRDVRRFLLDNQGAVADALKAAVRGFKR